MPTALLDTELDDHSRTLIQTSMVNYKRMARLELTMDTVNGKAVWCSAHQYEAAPGGKVLTEAEILERALEAFAPLHNAGYVPIISVGGMKNAKPKKPFAKHRMAKEVVLDGVQGFVLRQSRPRVLFALERGAPALLAAEGTVELKRVAILEQKVAGWFKRAPYRRDPLEG